MSKQNFIKGTFILTCTGLASRVIGFFYRIFLSHSIGAQGLGLYQLMVPLQNLVLALTTSGIQTALNRLIASQTALKHHREAKNIFCTGLLTAFSLSVGASWILYTNSDFFAGQILKQPLTEPLLQILSFSFPLSAIHSCINSYYFARKKTGIPSGLQLLEQLVRVSSSFLICRILISQNRPVTASIAAGGALVSELFAASAGLVLIAAEFSREQYSFFQAHSFAARLREICHTSFPLTLNRNGSPSDSFPLHCHKFRLCYAHALCSRNAGSWLPQEDPAHYRKGVYRLPASWNSLRGRLFSFWSFSWQYSLSQSHCRGLHPHHGLYLSFSVYEYCPGQYPSRSGKKCTKPGPQCRRDPDKNFLCAFCCSCNGNPRLSVRNPHKRNPFKQPSYYRSVPLRITVPVDIHSVHK